jgi:hypothetical protein
MPQFWTEVALSNGLHRDGLSDYALDAPIEAEAERLCFEFSDAISRNRDLSPLLWQEVVVPSTVHLDLFERLLLHEDDEREGTSRRDYFAEQVAMCQIMQTDELAAKTRREIKADVTRIAAIGYSQLFTQQTIRNVVERILFWCSWKRPSLLYFQGSGDIVAVFLVTCLEAAVSAKAAAPTLLRFDVLTEAELRNAEADAARLTFAFISRLESVFVDAIDAERQQRHLREIEINLTLSDPDVTTLFRRFDVKPDMWAFRTYFTLFTRDMSLRSCAQLWLRYCTLSSAEAVRWHQMCVASWISVALSASLRRAAEFEDVMVLLQRSPAVRFATASSSAQPLWPESFVSVLLRETGRTCTLRTIAERHIAILVHHVLLKSFIVRLKD